ncbi:MAG: protein-(glutamine-N5) methyltransferase, release factor-specific [Deltaproteobacteria bacterium]|nr:protein-(glutamine-N5) methyltransferase, release factor-specific [Deltaproteobacteria bacterium]HCH63882.1 peptide chain release factor N(5)-glutamine methyltransferase [Deltaproteobacteria bacterium]
MPTIADILQKTEDWFRTRGVPSARRQAQATVGFAIGVEPLQLVLQHDKPLSDAELEQIRAIVKRRGAREPWAYIEGSAGFHAFDFVVRAGVLCPRPDTETLVDAALALIPESADPVYVADVGSGTGCVGLSIAGSRSGVRLYATDVSDIALDVTRENVAALDLSQRVAVLSGPLLEPIPPSRPIDIVVSNPPYIPSAHIDTLMPEVRDYEPRLALDGGADGLDVYRALIPTAARRARKAVLVEIGHDQAEAVTALFRDAGLHHVQVHKDLGGRDRVISGHVHPVDQPAPDTAASADGDHQPARVFY